jgi:hypothetical protein
MIFDERTYEISQPGTEPLNAVEIEPISELADSRSTRPSSRMPSSPPSATRRSTLKRLRKGDSNKSDVGWRASDQQHTYKPARRERWVQPHRPARQSGHAKAKAKFILATDGRPWRPRTCPAARPHRLRLPDFPDHFGFFLPLAGITTVKQIRESAIDIRATSRLNKLYVELLKDNPDWATEARRPT